MSNQTKQEYVTRMKERYQKCLNRSEKSALITEMMTVLKVRRKSVLRLLHKKKKHRFVSKGRKILYGNDLVRPLSVIWQALGYPCSKRLVPQIPELVKVLTRHKELTLLSGQKELLLSMSNFTVNKLLKSEHKDPEYYGLSGTKTSPLLKTLIPIRTNFNEVNEPGHLEMDCVLHCGESLSGQYAQTLNLLDIHTHWNEKYIFMNKTKAKVISHLHSSRSQFPFLILSIDFDNGTEFVNWILYGYCQREHIAFTRCRSYHKNDQAHIEGKNYQSVRRLVGYARIDDPSIVDLINDTYQNEHRLLTNFFYPTMKLKTKEKTGGKISKSYEKAKTPYQRVLESPTVLQDTKQKLTALYMTLNPLELQRNLQKKLTRIKDRLSNTNYLAMSAQRRFVR